MQLTLIFFLANSTAADFVNETIAPFDEEYAVKAVCPAKAVIEEIKTTLLSSDLDKFELKFFNTK